MAISPIRFSDPIDARVLPLFDPDQFSTQKKYTGHLIGIRAPGGLVKNRIRRLAEHISQYDFDKDLVLACMLKGAMPFHAEMQKRISHQTTTALYGARSYEGEETSGRVKVYLFDPSDYEGKHVVLIEDISDSGLTLDRAQRDIKSANPKSLTTVVLFDKPDKIKLADPQLDGVGLLVPEDEFIVGPGLDYNGRYRDLYHVGVLHDSFK